MNVYPPLLPWVKVKVDDAEFALQGWIQRRNRICNSLCVPGMCLFGIYLNSSQVEFAEHDYILKCISVHLRSNLNRRVWKNQIFQGFLEVSMWTFTRQSFFNEIFHLSESIWIGSKTKNFTEWFVLRRKKYRSQTFKWASYTERRECANFSRTYCIHYFKCYFCAGSKMENEEV